MDDLHQLIEMIGPDNPLDANEPLTEQAFDDFVAELNTGEEIWESKMKIIEDDLFKYIDNPSRPSAMEKFKMLDRLGGENRWYDRWVSERNQSAADYFDDNVAAGGGGGVELVEMGFLESKKDGASKKLCPTRKFYEYFKLAKELNSYFSYSLFFIIFI